MSAQATVNQGSLPPWQWPRAAYVHIPFCAHRCGYCDFAIAVGRDDRIDAYLHALACELATLGRPTPVHSLFLGGGTPSHLPIEALARLLKDLAHWLPVDAGGEFSLEANPESLDADKVCLLAEHGLTRVSLGAQSFDSGMLQVLDRRHGPAEVPRAVERVRRRIPQVSLDLIFGVPGQTLARWGADLRATLALAPDHVSTYGLTYEKGTPLWKRRRRGQLQPLDEETELELYLKGIDTLTAAGFEHYEISNFGRPRCRSRHNEVYWANEAYFGFGMGAARYILGQRELNTRDLDTYLRCIESGQPATFQSEELSPPERARETMALQLRRSDGIDRPAFRAQTGFELDALAGEAIARHVALGMLADDGQRVQLTRQGKAVADAVIEGLL